jgi:hypothetical protein
VEYLRSIAILTASYQRDDQVVSNHPLQLKNHPRSATDRGYLYLGYGTKDEISRLDVMYRLKDGVIDLANHRLVRLIRTVAIVHAMMVGTKNYVATLGVDADKTAGW